MAGIKPDNVREFYRRLHARGETTSSLAAALGLRRHSYVSRLVCGHGRRRDGVWWPRLRALLTPEELALVDTPRTVAFATVRDAIAALPDHTRGPAKSTVRAFNRWQERQSA